MKPSTLDTVKKLRTLRTPEALMESSVIANAVGENLVRQKDQAASRKAWDRDKKANPFVRWQVPSFYDNNVPPPAPRVPRPCEVVSFTFSEQAGGKTVSRCLGIFPDGRRCAFGSGHSNKIHNSRTHRPEALGALAVDADVDADVELGTLEEVGAPEEIIAGQDDPSVELVETVDDDGKVQLVERGELDAPEDNEEDAVLVGQDAE